MASELQPWVILAVSIAVPSIIAYFFYRRAKRRKLLGYDYLSFGVISIDNPVEGLKLSYMEQEITSLNILRIAIRNEGNTEIRRNDIPPDDQLILRVNQGKILAVRTLSRTSDSNNFQPTLIPEDGSVRVEFEYLNPGEGATLQTFHEGKKEGLDIKMDGKIIGGEPPKKIYVATTSLLYRVLFFVILYGLVFTAAIFLYYSFLAIYPWLPAFAAIELGAILGLLFWGRIPVRFQTKKGFEEFTREQI